MASPETLQQEERSELVGALEAVLFAAGDPLAWKDIKRIFQRHWSEESEERQQELFEQLSVARDELKNRWEGATARGFTLVEVAEGLAFRSSPTYADVVRAMREEKPVRFSKPALETLAIVAYRQPVTKPELDDIRGVDCGGTLKWLLERTLVRIVGKKEEPGRPMLYGTTKQFLSFFNLGSLSQLPSLREFHELTDESQEELRELDATIPSLQDLSSKAKQLRLDEEPAVSALDDAVQGLRSTEDATRAAFSEHGISLNPEDEQEAEEPGPAPGNSD